MKSEKIDLYCLEYIGAMEEDYMKVVSNYILYYQEHAKIYKVQYYALSILKIIVLMMIPVIQTFLSTAMLSGIAAAFLSAGA